ncbi:hypothetical protein [Pseudofrankia asymbiotica]|uniref:Uncharacterized protein n=1 Tax=Pseudofrankia asymbiotica TaxID=1834516 RepID=A0A1V2I203_9ACTN|nr:hypothetical protein [Pseudofrankia asymbiotica]ONH23667.1 hypothetical protein BL253_32225 [Pseudofrankia asymbiotica]
MRKREADTLLRFVRVARPVAATAVSVTTTADDDQRAQADRIVRHWRNELVPLAALPGVGGRFTQPIREVLAGTVQGLLVLSLAQLRGVTDEREQVRLVAVLMLREDLPAGWTPSAPDPAHDRAGGGVDVGSGAETPEAEAGGPRTETPAAEVPDDVAVGPKDQVPDDVAVGPKDQVPDDVAVGPKDQVPDDVAVGPKDEVPEGVTGGPRTEIPAAEVSEAAAEESATWRLVAQQIPVAVYRAARELWTAHSLAGQRAEGRLWHRALGNLPAVGVVGATLGERHALADIAAAAYIELGLAAVEAPGPSVAERAATAAKGVAAHLPSFGRAARSPFRKS